MSGDSLELTAVRKRFNDAADTLEAVREHLNAVSLAEDAAVSSAATLESASGHLEAIAKDLGALTAEVAAAVRTAEQSLASADRFLQQTDLSELHGVLADVRATSEQSASDSAARLDQVATNQQEIADFVKWLHGHIGEVQVAEDRAAAAEDRSMALDNELSTLKQALPARLRSKLGIDTH